MEAGRLRRPGAAKAALSSSKILCYASWFELPSQRMEMWSMQSFMFDILMKYFYEVIQFLDRLGGTLDQLDITAPTNTRFRESE